MTCPDCGKGLLRGRWVIVRLVNSLGQFVGYRGRWEPSEDWLCPHGHGPFGVSN